MKNKLPLIIRDSVHGDIEILDIIAIKLINTPEFQRLRRINQLAGGQFIFPSACHNRFIHCIGVYHLISKIFETDSFKQKYINSKQRLIVKLAGLLHDIGHGPFSHTFEKINHVTKAKVLHENYSTLIIKSPETKINKILKTQLNDSEISELCAMIEGKHSNKVLSSLVSSQLDADRMDYLLRDGKNTGVEYSHLDIQWIIRHLNIIENKIVFPEKIQYAIESYLIGRYHMYKQVYLHPISIGFDLTFKQFFQRLYDLYNAGYKFKNSEIIKIIEPLLKGNMMSANDYCQLDDYAFFTYIKLFYKEDDLVLRKLSDMLINRDFLRQILPIKKNYNEIKKKLQNIYKIHYNYFIVKFNLKSIKLYDKAKKPIYIQNDSGLKTIDEISEIISSNNNSKVKETIYYFTLREFLKVK